jgi:hypothetical protein
MANWCYTDCTVSGPDAEIERFKEACFATEPLTEDEHRDRDGVDFKRVIPTPDDVRMSEGVTDWCWKNWGTKFARRSKYYVEEGRHRLFLVTAWDPPIPVLKKIVDMFPSISFVDIEISEEQGSFFKKGTITAAGVDLRDDEEAMKEFNDIMTEACEQAELDDPTPEGERAVSGDSPEGMAFLRKMIEGERD